jgi:hypothetical protein
MNFFKINGRGNAKNSNEKKMPRKNGGAGRKEEQAYSREDDN